MLSTHVWWTSSSQRQRSEKLDPPRAESGVAWKSRPLLKGGSVSYEVDGFAVHPAQDGQVVAVKQRPVPEVQFAYQFAPPCDCCRVDDTQKRRG